MEIVGKALEKDGRNQKDIEDAFRQEGEKDVTSYLKLAVDMFVKDNKQSQVGMLMIKLSYLHKFMFMAPPDFLGSLGRSIIN